MWLQVKESLGHQQLEAAGRVFLEEVVWEAVCVFSSA